MFEYKINFIKQQISFIKTVYVKFTSDSDYQEIFDLLDNQLEKLNNINNETIFKVNYSHFAKYIKNLISTFSDTTAEANSKQLLQNYKEISNNIFEELEKLGPNDEITESVKNKLSDLSHLSKPVIQKDVFSEIPKEIIQLVLSFTPVQAICRFGLTAKRYNEIANSNEVWKIKCQEEQFDISSASQQSNVNYKQLFIQKNKCYIFCRHTNLARKPEGLDPKPEPLVYLQEFKSSTLPIYYIYNSLKKCKEESIHQSYTGMRYAYELNINEKKFNSLIKQGHIYNVICQHLTKCVSYLYPEKIIEQIIKPEDLKPGLLKSSLKFSK